MRAEQLSEAAGEAIHACQMKPIPVATHGWGLCPVPEGLQPLHAYLGDRPPRTDEGYDFIGWAESLGFRVEPSLGDCPFIVVGIEPAPAGSAVAVLAYLEGTTSLTIWRSMTQARTGLPITFPLTAPESAHQPKEEETHG